MDADRPAQVVRRLAANELHVDAFAGERTFDENDLAVRAACDASAFGIERLYVKRQAFQRDRNSRQCGSERFSRVARRSSHSAA